MIKDKIRLTLMLRKLGLKRVSLKPNLNRIKRDAGRITFSGIGVWYKEEDLEKSFVDWKRQAFRIAKIGLNEETDNGYKIVAALVSQARFRVYLTFRSWLKQNRKEK